MEQTEEQWQVGRGADVRVEIDVREEDKEQYVKGRQKQQYKLYIERRGMEKCEDVGKRVKEGSEGKEEGEEGGMEGEAT